MEATLAAGPNVISQTAIAAGTLTEITEIIAPASANAGDLINVEVRVRNLSGDSIAVSCATALYDETPLDFSPDYLWADPGSIQSFTASFTMPTQGIRLHIGSFYYTGEEWIQDDYSYVDIALEEAPTPGISWLPLLLIGGVGVLGVGAAFALAPRK
ncbi:hypothetical protein ES703_76808 [subsurface metagenome]